MGSNVSSNHHKYQPDRTDILWNTDWGIDKSALSAEEARKQGLASYKGRWVTSGEKTILKDQYASYRSIRTISVLVGLHALVALIPTFMAWSGRSLPPGKSASGVIAAAAFLWVATALWKFRKWARYAAILILVLGATMSLGDSSEGAPLIGGMIMVALCLYYLCRGSAGIVFNKPRAAPAAATPAPTGQSTAASPENVVDAIQ